MKKLFQDMLAGKYSEDEMAEILKQMALRGETVEEITELCEVMRANSVSLPEQIDDLMDTCGTGGSGLPRMNISTVVAFVLAAGGVKVAKHGNKAASGRCGSFDLLEALGLNINLEADQVVEVIKKTNLGFLFAPLFHPGMKIFAPVRKKLGIRTIFNLIGPLINPAKPKYHLLGTNSKTLAHKLAMVMKNLSYKRAMVVACENGLDEVGLMGKTFCYELIDGQINYFEFVPEDVGIISISDFEEIAGGSVQTNVGIFKLLLKGQASKSMQNLLELNSGFALYVRGFVDDIKTGVLMSRDLINSGKVFNKFKEYEKISSGN